MSIWRSHVEEERARLQQDRQRLEDDRRRLEEDKQRRNNYFDSLQKQNEAETDRKSKEAMDRLHEEEQRIKKYLDGREQAFKQGFCIGRKWLADFIAECERARDNQEVSFLLYRAAKAAEIVKQVKTEKRELTSKLKFVEYQLRSYEEYFPFLEDYREAILDETIRLSGGGENLQNIEEADPVLRFLSRQEYEELSSAEKNQRALERYLRKPKTNWEVGRLYERYLGYIYEKARWKVSYEGAIKGFEDFGRDLICVKDDIVRIVQAKYWRKEFTVREKHVFQLFGTSCHFKRTMPGCRVQAVLYSTTNFSEDAEAVAEELKVTCRVRPFDQDYPMIKCNVNPTTKEKIYHLPFDQQYDRVVIGNQPGELYVKTTQEAEALGFRRAWKHLGPW